MGRSRSSSESSGGSDKSGKGWSKKEKKDKKDKKDKDKKEKDEKKSKDKKEKDKDKDKDKKDKKEHKDEGHHSKGPEGHSGQAMQHQMPLMPEIHGSGFPQAPGFPQHRSFDQAGSGQQSPSGNTAPPSGYRIPLTTTSTFPPPDQTGHPPLQDLDGSPVFIGSALLENSVQPCKIAPALSPPCMVPYGGQELNHHGRYDLLPFDSNTMEFVSTSHGRIPSGRRPVEGGYEENGAKLYHAVAVVQGLRVPGKAGEHLGAAHVSFGGSEHSISDHYEILCWKY
ncbi:hypothetical protein PM082_016085 [Marasmius tenuissimus]|nr:hypothetical protein PM082_016085 [Marasmius tenuissimus]